MNEDQEFQEYETFAKRLEKSYPKMYSGSYGGIAVGKGWWPIIECLSKNIQQHIEFANRTEEVCPQVVVEQVKEKFGGLRFYYEGGDEQIHGMVRMAEELAGMSCEDCGAPGKRRGSGWVRTLCDKHEAERNARIEDQERRYGLEL